MCFYMINEALFMLIHLWVVNTACVLFWRIWCVELSWWWPPADFGVNFFDGRRLFGPHKSWLGNGVGVLVGVVFGLLFTSLYWGVVYSLGATLGSFLLSFIKRRLNMKPGAPFFPFDQMDYLLGTLVVFLVLRVPVNVFVFLVAVFITVPLHIFGNLVIYKIGLRRVPW